jgi:hypothetical protein
VNLSPNGKNAGEVLVGLLTAQVLTVVTVFMQVIAETVVGAKVAAKALSMKTLPMVRTPDAKDWQNAVVLIPKHQ